MSREKEVAYNRSPNAILSLIGIDEMNDSVWLPPKSFCDRRIIEGDLQATTQLSLLEGTVMIGLNNGPLAPIANKASEEDIMCIYDKLELKDEERQKINRFSRASMVLDVATNGINGDSGFFLSRSLLLQAVADVTIGEELASLSLKLVKNENKSGMGNQLLAEYHNILDGFIKKASPLIDRIGFTLDLVKEELADRYLLEASLKTGRRDLALLNIRNDLRVMTLLLGTRASWIMAGEIPESTSYAHFLSIEGNQLELPPTHLGEAYYRFESGIKSEYSNVMSVYRDLVFGQMFPKGMSMAEQILSNKTGIVDPFYRMLVYGNLENVDIFRLQTLTDSVKSNHMNLWIENSCKTASGLLKKACFSAKNSLSKRWKERDVPLIAQYSNINPSVAAVSAFEETLSLRTMNNVEDLLLIGSVEQNMTTADDIVRKRIYLPESTFNEVVAEMSLSDGSAFFVADGYKKNVLNEKVRHELPDFDQIGITPYEWFINERHRLIKHLEQDGDTALVFATVSFKINIGTPENPLVAALQMGPNDRDVIIDNWRTRPHYVRRD